jgi:cytochrome c biogenesis protein CcmG/thiol:disulfide interchange protein DsbE
MPTPRRQLLRRIGVGTGIALFVGSLVVVFGSRFGVDPRVVDSPLIGVPAPSVSMPFLGSDGSTTFDDFRGEVVVVNFWASWCLPCRAEFPYLNAASLDYRDRGVRFVGVVYQEDVDSALGYLDEVGWPDGYVHVLDPDSKVAIEFGVYGIPETFVLDRDGVIRDKITGGVDRATLAGSLERVLELDA